MENLPPQQIAEIYDRQIDDLGAATLGGAFGDEAAELAVKIARNFGELDA